MFMRHRFPDSNREYWEIYRKTRVRMEAWSEEELRNFLAGFSFIKRLLMHIIYYPDAPAYQAARDVFMAKSRSFSRYK